MVANSIRRSVVSWLISLACCVYVDQFIHYCIIVPLTVLLYTSDTGPPVLVRHRRLLRQLPSQQEQGPQGSRHLCPVEHLEIDWYYWQMQRRKAIG